MTWILLLIPVGITLGVGIILLFHAVQKVRFTHRLNRMLSSPKGNNEIVLTTSESPGSYGLSLFDQPCRWLAIKGENLHAVQEALHLHHVMPCSCAEGLVEAHEDKLFISPPILGWILVVGLSLPDPSEDVDRCFHFLTDLSRKLGEVQFFDVNRVLNYHAWVLTEKGRVQRAYAWADRTVWNQGTMTAAERELELSCFDYASDLVYTQREALAVNTEKVTQLAAEWSIDPSAIPEPKWNTANGLVGEFSMRR